MFNFSNLIRNFSQEEDGIALTEYLILLGLLTGCLLYTSPSPRDS